jgi:hypothetical protein
MCHNWRSRFPSDAIANRSGSIFIELKDSGPGLQQAQAAGGLWEPGEIRRKTSRLLSTFFRGETQLHLRTILKPDLLTGWATIEHLSARTFRGGWHSLSEEGALFWPVRIPPGRMVLLLVFLL